MVQAVRMKATERLERAADWTVGLTEWAFVIESATVIYPAQQVHVGAAIRRRTERRHQRDLVRRIVDRTQAREQVAHLLGVQDQPAALNPIRHVLLPEGALESAQVRSTRDQHTDVAVTSAARGAIRALVGNAPRRLAVDDQAGSARDGLGFGQPAI